MLLFWVAAAVLSAAAAGLVLARAGAAGQAMAEDPALAVHRRHLAELDELAERGLLDEAEGRAARAEAGRRLLAAAEAAQTGPRAATSGERRLILVLVALVPVLSLALYVFLGNPGRPDEPFAQRIAAWSKEPLDQLMQEPDRFGAVMQVLADKNPGNALILRNLAEAQIAQNQTVLAEATLRKAIAAAPNDARPWLSLAHARMLAARDEFDPGAVQALREALKRDPKDPEARYRLARTRIHDGDLAGGLAELKALQAELPPGSQERQGLGIDIAQIEKAGGLPPPPPPQAAAPQEGQRQQQKIAGMVGRLAARLQANPDDPDGWVLLVRAYTVQGDLAKRDEALAAARKRFASKPDVLKKLDDALTKPVEGPPR